MNLSRADKVLLTGLTCAVGSAAVFGPSPLALGVPLGALVALLTDGIARPSSCVLCPTVSHVTGARNQVALTFDDGPDPEITPRIVDILGAHNARATFFVIGRLLERRLDVARRVLAAGHELGNHSWRHAYLQSMYSTKALGRDVDSAAELLASLLPRENTLLYRAPVGIKSPPLARVAQARGLKVIAWSVHSRDTIDSNPKRVADRVLKRIKGGDIVLLHDGHEREGYHRTCAAEALPRILSGLKERNLVPVTVSTLLEAQTPAQSAVRGS